MELRDVERRRIQLPESGLEIAILDWGGDGPLAFLHHANGLCGGMWGLVAEELRSSFRLIAMDARGHGDSSKPTAPDAYHWGRFPEDLLHVAGTVARELGAPCFRLGIGHSFGGTTTLAASARRPDLFEKIVLVDPVIHPPAGERTTEPAEHLKELIEGARRRRSHWESRDEAREWFDGRKIFADWRPEAIDLYVREALAESPDGGVELKCPGEVEASVFAQGRTLDVFPLAPKIEVPALLLWARRSNFPREIYERLIESMPDARIETVDSGHLVPMEHPEVVVEAVLRAHSTG